ncbi:ABC transporter substrate-binding protein [Evansella sp. LMS18]|jgi:multiple sugar transport system substrate-binding protein|uniref:ABC transporter substrate-binding protein n=1 Tax=Evansella sp. LMS18 TaxID=2924033 RepID=UPI0020CFEF29|nr:ABC transporter substrate-binding protein [Evansella sp. LMS18]UTR12679.1 ABC transporter substrate-binding protein [Evansella sp. LMS18]
MKKFTTLFFSTAILLTAAACNNNDGNEAGSGNENESGNNNAAEEDVTLSVWVMGTDEYWRSYHDDLVDRFHEDHPNITVELDYIPWDEGESQLINSSANNTLPDVSTIAGRWTAQMVAMDVVEPLDDYYNEAYPEEFVDAAWNTTQYEGSTWGLPAGFTTTGLFYRADWFEEEGIEEPPATWDELLETAKTFTDGERYGFGIVGDGSMETTLFWAPFLWGNGGDFLTEDMTEAVFNSQEGVEALEFYTELYREAAPEGSINNSRGDSQNLFLADSVAMTTVGPWFPKFIEDDAPDMDYGITEYPVKEQAANLGTADHIAMFNTSEHKEAAWTFMEYFTNEENDLTWAKHQGFIPYRSANLTDDEILNDPDMAFFLDVAEDAVSYPTLPEWPQIDQAVADAVQQALMGAKSPEEALNDAAEAVNQLLEN